MRPISELVDGIMQRLDKRFLNFLLQKVRKNLTKHPTKAGLEAISLISKLPIMLMWDILENREHIIKTIIV